MASKKQASILAIGNELLLGQIINKNAALISEKLLDYNIRVVNHMVVPDKIDKIVEGLKYISASSDIIFTIGGMGPTEDDLTREGVASFLKTPLSQDEQVLKDLKLKLQKRGVQFTLNHIKQAQFPTGSYVMKNDVGTADGFHISFGNKELFAVPGPWGEISSCWDNYIHKKLDGVSSTKILLERYQIIGLPESEISNQVQDILKGSEFEAEYRVHFPFVEVRIDLAPEKMALWSSYDQAIQAEFKNFLVGKGGVDMAQNFVDKIKDKKVLIVDAASHGYIGERILPLVKDLKVDFFQIAALPAAYAADNYEMFFDIRPVDENEWVANINNTKQLPIQRLGQNSIRAELLRRKFSELFFWKIVNEI